MEHIQDLIPTLLFYLGINYSLFIFMYAIDPSLLDFIPKRKEILKPKRLLFRSYKAIKLSGELTTIGFTLILFKKILPAPIATIILASACWLIFVYHIYYTTIRRFFNTNAIMYIDWRLIKLGTRILWHGYPLALILVIGLFFGSFYFYYWISNLFVPHLYQLSDTSSILMLGLFLAIILVGIKIILPDHIKIWGYYKKRIIFTSNFINYNFRESFATKKMMVRLKNTSEERKNSRIQSLPLKKKPNLFFLFIESYGSVLYKPYFQKEYKSLCNELEKKFTSSGWSAYSHLSTSPRSGGASWLAYSSFFYGVDVKEEGLLRIIVNKKEEFNINHSLLQLLRQAGYENNMLVPLTGFNNFKVDWEQISEQFSMDRIIKFEDLDYTGPLVGAFGKQPPDQYSINKAMDIVETQSKNPFAFFFVTLNSHAIWKSPIDIQSDWKDIPNSEVPLTKTGKNSYFPAIRYQLQTMTDFITNRLGEDDIVVLLGDHQPPLLVSSDDPYETPIHIFAKKPSLLEGLSQYGFQKGLYLDSLPEKCPRHSGMYYALIRHLMSISDIPESEQPEYLREGYSI